MVSLCIVLKSILMFPIGPETSANGAQCNRAGLSFTVGALATKKRKYLLLLWTDHNNGLNLEYFVICI